MATSSDVVVSTTHLSKHYGRTLAVDNLNLNVQRGQVFGFLGPNGAGKTTTVGMILGLVAPTSGNIEIFGLDIKRNLPDILCKIGAVIENPGFYPYLSGWDNLQVFARISCNVKDNRIKEVLELVDLSNRAQDKFGSYSQGMKQRLAIACALLEDPELIILDEPTNGLDPAGMKEIRELITNLGKQGKTLFLNSHLLHEVEQVCDHVGIIKKGKLIALGAPKDLIKRVNLISLGTSNNDKAVEILKAKDWISSVTLEDNLILVNTQAERTIEISELLAGEKIFISEMKAQAESLENFFLELTEE